MGCYELGRQPLGVASPKAFLERAGFRPACADLQVEALDPALVDRARLAVVSVPMHTALRLGLREAERIRRRNPSCRIAFHGHYALLNAEHLLAGPADFVLAGECEERLVGLARALDRGEEPALDGRPVLEHLDFPVPSRAGLPAPERYGRLLHRGETRMAGQVEASRGCKHLCTHCPIPPLYEGRFFAVPVETVVEDAARQIEAGVRHLSFADPDFLNGPRHGLRVARALHERWPELTFDVTAKVEHLLAHGDLLAELRELGLLFVVSAVESLDEVVLANLDKGHDRGDVEALADLFDDLGLTLRPTFVPFTPWETLEGYRGLLEFLARRSLVDCVEPVQLSIRLLVPPGSLLEKHPALQPHLDELVPDDFTWTWTHPDPRMDQLQQEVAALVERDADEGADPRATFVEIRTLAAEAADGWPSRKGLGLGRGALAAHPPLPPPPDVPPPRLTEDWFC